MRPLLIDLTVGKQHDPKINDFTSTDETIADDTTTDGETDDKDDEESVHSVSTVYFTQTIFKFMKKVCLPF